MGDELVLVDVFKGVCVGNDNGCLIFSFWIDTDPVGGIIPLCFLSEVERRNVSDVFSGIDQMGVFEFTVFDDSLHLY